MTLKKLSSKRIFAVCKTQLYQMRLLFILFGLILAVIPTLYVLGELSNRYWDATELKYIKEMVMGTIAIGGFAPMFGLGMAMAVQQFGYLHKRQKLDYFHAVPVLRAEHFLGRALSAFVALTVASALVALGQIFAVGVSIGFSGNTMLSFILWRCFWIILPSFIAYLFTVLMLVLTATLWESIFSLLAVSALSPAVFLLASVLIESAIPIHEPFERWDCMAWFSPLVYSVYYIVELGVFTKHSLFVPVVVVGVLQAAICGGIAMWVFCRRKSELAESNMPTRFKLLVRFSAAFCAAALGSVVLLWVSEKYVVYWIGAIIGVVIAWLIMEILYTRSLRKVMGTLWVNALGFVLFIAINALVMFGFIGIPDIPNTEDVYAVSVAYGKEVLETDGNSYYHSFDSINKTVYSDEGKHRVSMATWDEEQIKAGAALAEAMLENQKDLYFPYIPHHWGGYSRYVTYDWEDAKDEIVSYDVTLRMHVDGRVENMSYGAVEGSGRIEELYDRAKAISETEEYRMSNPTLVMMDHLTEIQYQNYEVSVEPQVYSLREYEDIESFIQRLKEAYLEDLYAYTKGQEEEALKYYSESGEPVAAETRLADEFTLILDPAAQIVLKGGLLDSMYEAKGFACRLSPEYTKAFDRNANYWTDSAELYFHPADFPRTCALLDELRAELPAI